MSEFRSPEWDSRLGCEAHEDKLEDVKCRMTSLLALLGSLLIRLLRLTWRVTLAGPDPPYDDGPIVFCFWHGAQAGLLAHPRPRPVTVLSSHSRDGELQARILTRLGFVVHRGSSSRGGARGLKEIIGEIAGGADAAFAVDGPRGPLHEVKPGALAAAKAAGASVVPITTRASRFWTFDKAWDRYRLPKPFARVELVRGEPLGPGAFAEDLERALEGLDH